MPRLFILHGIIVQSAFFSMGYPIASPLRPYSSSVVGPRTDPSSTNCVRALAAVLYVPNTNFSLKALKTGMINNVITYRSFPKHLRRTCSKTDLATPFPRLPSQSGTKIGMAVSKSVSPPSNFHK